jgi:hypothetical protein
MGTQFSGKHASAASTTADSIHNPENSGCSVTKRPWKFAPENPIWS